MKNKVHTNPITISEQIENLRNIGLKFNDVKYAKEVLTRISYYRLIKGYSINLKENGRYKKNVTFEDIISLYEFNGELRTIILKLVEDVEISLRANITNHFSIKYGNFSYKDINNFEKKNFKK